MRNLQKVKNNVSLSKSMTNLFRTKKDSKSSEDKLFFDLSIFWTIFQEETKAPTKIKDLALNSLI